MEHKNLKLQSTSAAPAIASTEAAQRFGLTNDHIASLCRRGKVEGELKSGRVWFVNEESLKKYLDKATEERAARHRALSQKFRSEQGAQVTKSPADHFLQPRYALAMFLPLFLAAAVQLTSPQGSAASQYIAAATAQYGNALEVALELQVDAYRTLGAALGTLSTPPALPPAAAPARAIPLPGSVPQVEDVLGKQLSRIPARLAAGVAGHRFEPVVAYEPFLRAPADPIAVHDLPQLVPQALLGAWEMVFVDGARGFVRGVYMAGDMQDAFYKNAIAALYALSDEISAAVLLAADDISYSVSAVALWYVDSVDTVYARTELR